MTDTGQADTARPAPDRPAPVRAPAWLGALCGLLAALAALAVAELAATLVRAQASPVIAVGGRVIDATPQPFDVVQPRYDLIAEAMQSVPPLRVDIDNVAPRPGVARLLRSYYDSYDPVTQTLHSTNRYELHHDGGHVEHRLIDLDWHIYFPEELDLLLAAAGLAPVERYGDYERGPWTAASRRYLWVAEAR